MTFDPMFDIGGRVVVITGAAGGIGAALCRGFVERDARVVGVDLTDAGAAPDGVTYRRCDIGDRGQVAELAAFVAAEFGHADVLINNAGIERSGKAEDYDDANWGPDHRRQPVGHLRLLPGLRPHDDRAPAGQDHQHRLGLRPVRISLRRGLQRQQGGRMVDDADTRRRVGLPQHPGQRDRTGLRRDAAHKATLDDPETLELNRRIIPSGRLSQPEDLVGPIVFLASPVADYVSGELLVVDAGTVASGAIGTELRDDGLRKGFGAP